MRNFIFNSHFPYMTPLQPVEPEEQKLKMLRKYEKELLLADGKFTFAIQKRYKCLLQSVSFTCYS